VKHLLTDDKPLPTSSATRRDCFHFSYILGCTLFFDHVYDFSSTVIIHLRICL